MATQETFRNQFEEEPEQSLETATPIVDPVAPLEDLKVTGPRYTDSNLTSAWLVAANYDLNQKKEELVAEEQEIIEQSIARVEQDLTELDNSSDTYSVQDVTEHLQTEGFSNAAIEAAQNSLKNTQDFETSMQQTQLQEEQAQRATIIKNNLGTSPSEELVKLYQQEDKTFEELEKTIDKEITSLRHNVETDKATVRRDEKLFSVSVDIDKIIFDNKKLKSHLDNGNANNSFYLNAIGGFVSFAGSSIFLYASYMDKSSPLVGGVLMAITGAFFTKGYAARRLCYFSQEHAVTYLGSEHSKVKNVINKIKAEGLHPVISCGPFTEYNSFGSEVDRYTALIIDVYPNAQEVEAPKLGFINKLMKRYLFKKKK